MTESLPALRSLHSTDTHAPNDIFSVEMPSMLPQKRNPILQTIDTLKHLTKGRNMYSKRVRKNSFIQFYWSQRNFMGPETADNALDARNILLFSRSSEIDC